MAANIETGKVREVRYCGRVYTVKPGAVWRKKQCWAVWLGEANLTNYTPTLGQAFHVIHNAAVENGDFPARREDGLDYEGMQSALRR